MPLSPIFLYTMSFTVASRHLKPLPDQVGIDKKTKGDVPICQAHRLSAQETRSRESKQTSALLLVGSSR